MIFDAATDVARGGDAQPGVRFEFSPEVFNLTEPDYVLQVCDSLTELWDASPDRPVIHTCLRPWRSRRPMCMRTRSSTCTAT